MGDNFGKPYSALLEWLWKSDQKYYTWTFLRGTRGGFLFHHQDFAKEDIMEQINAPGAYADRLKSVEFYVSRLNRIYQFKVWGNTLTSMFVLVKEDSELVEQFGVGDVYEMTFYGMDSSGPSKNVNTKIKYFDKIDQGRFKGHYLTGLSIE